MDLDPTRDPDRWRRTWTLFHGALERPEPERAAYLARAVGADCELRREVEELLAAHAGEDDLLDRPAVADEDLALLFPEPADLEPGSVLAGRFEVVRLLGSGGMGSVHEAVDRELGMRVALKTLRPEIARDAGALARFRQEIGLARQITHPNVCRIYDLFSHRPADGSLLHFVTMELLDGETLGERIRRDGPLSPGALLPIAEQVVAGLEAAHRVGIVHRDLKPGNVMLAVDAERSPAGQTRAVVADFGLAAPLAEDDGARLTRAGQLIGTPAYMAPEQLTGDPVTVATDVYALGLVLYEALTGELPFGADSPFSGALRRLGTPPPSLRSRAPGLPRRWVRTVARCLRRDPAQRFASAAEVGSSLRGDWMAPAARRWSAVAAILLLALGAALLWQRVAATRDEGTSSDPAGDAAAAARADPLWVLITAFDNRTGEELFDGVLESALRRELANSRLVNAIPRERIADTLRLMQRPVDTEVDAALGREVALRDGGLRLLLAGAAQKLGSSYLLSVEVVRVEDGVTIASLEEEAEEEEEVLPAVRRLANGIRRVLGERPETIEASDRRLARVTTPSLRALQLFSEASSFGFVRDNRAAEELLRQAVAEDPHFASAHMVLAKAIQQQGRPQADYLPHAERAMQLADATSPSERYDIRADYFWMDGRLEDALASYRARAELDSGPATAAPLMALYAFELGRYEEAVPHAVALAEHNPNAWFANFQAARALTKWGNRPLEAAPYAARACELLEAVEQDEKTPIGSWFASWVRAFPAHLRWLEGDVRGMAALADGWLEELRSAPVPTREDAWPWFIADVYVYLGRLTAAEEVCRLAGGGTCSLDTWRGDDESLRELLARQALSTLDQDQSGGGGVYLAIGLARAGLVEEARTVTEELAVRQGGAPSYAGARRPTPAMVAAARGELALAEGRPEEALPLLEQASRELRASGLAAYFRVCESLASLLDGQGERSRAVALLEEASRQRGRLHGDNQLRWMEVRLLLAELYERDGRTAEAREILDELRGLLSLADSDFALLRRLNELSIPS